MSDYIPTIGLEIHAELATASKMFCGSPNDPDAEPNTNVCPICMAHPGTLPTINKEAVRYLVMIGHAINGEVAHDTEFDRKNYFYPDIPKGYQISQYDRPLVTGGSITGVSLTRIHLEEDTAKSHHDRGDYSLVDYNRAGVPLMELVTEPDITSGEQAAAFAKELQLLLRYLGAGEANMEKGQMRVEANVSVSPDGERYGTKVEVKNLNSFRAVQHAVAYEIERQRQTYEAGEEVNQETRGWDEHKEVTFAQRAKEESHDYRYFPEPDLVPMRLSEVSAFQETTIRSELPELPWERRVRLQETYRLDEKTAEMLVQYMDWGEYFERVCEQIGDDEEQRRLALNYLTSDLFGMIKHDETTSLDEAVPSEVIAATSFARVIAMAAEKTISSRGAKDLLAILYEHGGDPDTLATEHNLIQTSNTAELEPIVDEIIAENPQVVADYQDGNENVLQFLVGQGMKKTQGSANPQMLQQLLAQKLQQ